MNREVEKLNAAAAKIYHSLYPRANFYDKPTEMHRLWRNTLVEISKLSDPTPIVRPKGWYSHAYIPE